MNYPATLRELKEDQGDPVKICSLINSVFYFLNWVYIIDKQGSFRLIVNHKGKLIFDKPYGSLRGAKIAFSKLFKDRGWKNNVKAEWSFFYEPECRWLQEKKGA